MFNRGTKSGIANKYTTVGNYFPNPNKNAHDAMIPEILSPVGCGETRVQADLEVAIVILFTH